MDKVSSKISKHTEMCIQQSHIGHCILAKKNSPVAFRFQCLLRIEDIFPYHQKNKKNVSRYQNVQGFETCNILVNIKCPSAFYMTQQITKTLQISWLQTRTKVFLSNVKFSS